MIKIFYYGMIDIDNIQIYSNKFNDKLIKIKQFVI